MISIESVTASLEEIIWASPYYVHAICLSFDPWLVIGLTIEHLVIWICYLIISSDFRKDSVSKRFPMPALFNWFICLCGWSHFAALITIWTPWYWISFAINGATVIASIPAAYFFRKLRVYWEELDRDATG